MQYDWALVELAEKVPQELMDLKAIIPICLPANNEPVNAFDDVQLYGQGGILLNSMFI